MLTTRSFGPRFRNFVTGLGAVGVLAAVGAVGAVGACSSDSDNPTGTTTVDGGSEGGNGDGGGGSGDGGGGGGKDTGADAAPVVLNDCRTFKDSSAAGDTRTIPWTIPLVAPERCMTVKKGQSVTWSGNFVDHPLDVKGGDMPNPIADVDAAGKVTFDTVGLFGFECGVHPSMTGAIKVIE